MPFCASAAYLLEESALCLFLLSLPAIAVIQTISLKENRERIYNDILSLFTAIFLKIENKFNTTCSCYISLKWKQFVKKTKFSNLNNELIFILYPKTNKLKVPFPMCVTFFTSTSNDNYSVIYVSRTIFSTIFYNLGQKSISKWFWILSDICGRCQKSKEGPWTSSILL